MSSGVLRPAALGGTISVFDSDSLAAMDSTGLPIGSMVWSIGVGAFFALTTSTAALVTDQVVAVSGITGMRWIKAAGATVTTDSSLTGNGASLTPLSVVNANKLTELDFDGWFTAQAALMKTSAPALTNFREVKLGDKPSGLAVGSIVNDASEVGGGVTHLGGQFLALANSIVQTGRTTSFALALRSKLPTPNGSNFYFAGLTNAGTTDFCGFASYGTGSASKWVIYMFHGGTETIVATSNNADTNYHDFVFTFDGTTVKLFIDGTLRASTATLTALIDEALIPVINGPVTGNVKAVRFAYGYIAP